jgi:hypothetical protein
MMRGARQFPLMRELLMLAGESAGKGDRSRKCNFLQRLKVLFSFFQKKTKNLPYLLF